MKLIALIILAVSLAQTSKAAIDEFPVYTPRARMGGPRANKDFPIVDAPDYKGAIVPAKEASRHRYLAKNFKDFWTPSPEQVAKAEAKISVFIDASTSKQAAEIRKKLKRFRRQYVGHIAEGEKLILWSHEAENLKLFRKLCRIPDLAILGFEALPLGRWVVRFHRAVDRRQSAAADFFGFVICGHNCRLWHRPGCYRHWCNKKCGLSGRQRFPTSVDLSALNYSQYFLEQIVFFGRPGQIEQRLNFLRRQKKLVFLQLPGKELFPRPAQQWVLAEFMENSTFYLSNASSKLTPRPASNPVMNTTTKTTPASISGTRARIHSFARGNAGA